jgi:hypothetical protein
MSNVIFQDMDKFYDLRDNPPQVGDVIYAKDWGYVPIEADGPPDEPVLFVRMAIDEECTGWYLSQNPKAPVVLISKEDHRKLYVLFKDESKMKLSAVKLVAYTRTGTLVAKALFEWEK